MDDSPLMLSVLREYFRSQPTIHVVGTAANGVEALKKVQALHPQLVLMDLHMPRLNGLEATTIMRQRFPAVRVLIMTMDPTSRIRKDCRAAGAQGVVSKPTLSRHLWPQIRRFFPE